MRGSPKGQTLHLFTTSGINCIGLSKLQDKDGARVALSREGRSCTSTALAEKTGIHSFKTRDNYLGKWQELARFTKEEFRLRDLEKLTTEHVRSFLSYKVELGVSYSHFNGYAAAFSKLDNALNLYSSRYERGNEYNIRVAIRELRIEARAELPRFTGTRNYDNQVSLVAVIGNRTHQLVARIQLEGGMRVAEASNINAGQLGGLAKDELTGKTVGLVHYIGKGGKKGTAQLTRETYKKLVEYIREFGHLQVGPDVYRQSLKVASAATGQTYNGSHGLRWNFAQERFAELQAAGVGYEKSLGVVSSELNHNRMSMSLHYLGVQ